MKQYYTPKDIVEYLDDYIIGQDNAKKLVAIALRNRYRRDLLPADIKEEFIPKNILMIGPTGVGKTEIARRLARLTKSPFVKVEATKYTEVGYVGRDVESMVRELVEVSIRMVKKEKLKEVEDVAKEHVIYKIAEIVSSGGRVKQKTNAFNSFMNIFSGQGVVVSDEEDDDDLEVKKENIGELADKIRQGLLDEEYIEIEVQDTSPSMVEIFSAAGMEEMGINFQDLFGSLMPKRKKLRRVKIKEAKQILFREESDKLIDFDEVKQLGLKKAENDGIIFIDEIDKISGRESGKGPDVSREGVQRDILPLLEGSSVTTKYGVIKTDHILFIAAGAFHVSKPSDLIPELQGRFPIRVELDSLTEQDFYRILKEPKNSLIRQYRALLATEDVNLIFKDDAIKEIARLSALVNTQTENIGARRLHTIIEKVVEEVSFNSSDYKGKDFVIDANYVQEVLKDIVKSEDLSRYIL